MNESQNKAGEPVQGHISVAYLRVLQDFLAARGCVLADLPGGSELQALDPDTLVMPVLAWRALLQEAATRLALPTLGLALGASMQISQLGLLGYALQSCATLGDALTHLQHYERLVNDINRLHWESTPAEAGAQVVLAWGTERGRPGALVDECAVATLCTATRQISGRPDLNPLGVDFINPAPADIAPYEAFFGCPVRFAQPRTRVCFPGYWLDLPLQRPDPVLADLLAAQVDSLLDRLPAEADIVQQTRRALARRLRQQSASLDSVAADLCLSPRTLHRRLEAAGVNFRSLWEDTRRHLAEEYLRDQRLSLSDVATLLGFSEQSAFTRAFRRWHALGPKAWRARQSG